MFRRLAPSATLVALSVVAVFACSKDSTAPAGPVACTITFSGAFSGAYDCVTKPIGTYTTSTDTVVIQGGKNTDPSVSMNFQFKGAPVAGTYKHSDANRRGLVSATNAGGTTGYIASVGGILGQANTGTWTLVISSVTQDSITATGKKYSVHGTLDATMTPFGGGASSTLSMVF